MKKLILAITMVLATTLISTRAVAAEKKTTTKTVTTSSSSSSSWSESKMRYGFGFTTYGAGGNGAVSFMLEFNDLTSLQPFFGILASSPFSFSVGGVLRHTLHGGRDNGLHGGLGFNLGTVGGAAPAVGSTFFLNIFPVVGYHFSLGGHVSNLKLSFDVGPMFEITPTFQFRTQPLSALGGVSMHYMF